MRELFKKISVGHRCVVLLFCTFLIATALVPMVGISEKITRPSVNSEPINTYNKLITNDPSASLRYSFLFSEPSLTDVTLFNNQYTKISMPGTIATGLSLGAPELLVNNV